MPRASLSSRSRQPPRVQKRPPGSGTPLLFPPQHSPFPSEYVGRYTSVYQPLHQNMAHASLFNPKKRSPFLRHFASSVPLPALLCSIALAFFVFGVLFSRNVSVMFDASSPQHFGLPTRSLSAARSVLNLSDARGDKDVVEPHADSKPIDHKPHHHHEDQQHHGHDHNQLDTHNQHVPHNDARPSSNDARPAPVAASLTNDDPPADCCVGMWRSWPISKQYDFSHLYQVADHLNFTNNTLLNYFHMHKTGGVTTKYEVMVLIRRYENKIQLTSAGRPLTVIETCYQQNYTNPENDRLENSWHCDFGQVEAFSPQKLASIDMVMGHQYWEEGCEMYFGPIRDVKHFSIFRHPLARKLSFFYHFFVRNLQRDENEVGKDEVIAFLLGDAMPENDALTRDAGPNYYASRMISDGVTGFENHRYIIPSHKQEEAIANVLHKLRHKYAFVGLQLQPEASQCMLQKMIQVFAHVHGLDKMYGTPKLAESKKRLNVGGYPWTPKKVWAAMTPEQRQRYREVEKVDLAIYEHVVQRFKEDLKVFACEHRVHADQWAEDQFDEL